MTPEDMRSVRMKGMAVHVLAMAHLVVHALCRPVCSPRYRQWERSVHSSTADDAIVRDNQPHRCCLRRWNSSTQASPRCTAGSETVLEYGRDVCDTMNHYRSLAHSFSSTIPVAGVHLTSVHRIFWIIRPVCCLTFVAELNRQRKWSDSMSVMILVF